MKVRNITAAGRLVPLLEVEVDAGAAVTIPPELAESFLCQPWYWGAADRDAEKVAAAHPEWWAHPHVEECRAAGAPLAAAPKGGE